MPPLKKLIRLLEDSNAKYELTEHRKVFTAYDAAQTQHLDLKMIAKVLLVQLDKGRYAFVAIPAKKKLDTNKVKKELNKLYEKNDEPKTKKVRIASEGMIMKHFTKGKGPLPPFGSLYKVPTLVDRSLMKLPKISFNAGSFTESIVMTPAQYKKIEELTEGSFGK